MKKLERENMTKKIYDAVIEILKQGNYKVGDKIPTELSLCEQLGVSRNSIREVSKALTLAGITTSVAGKGTFLNKEIGSITLSDQFLPDINGYTLNEIMDVRTMLEMEAGERAAENCRTDPAIAKQFADWWQEFFQFTDLENVEEHVRGGRKLSEIHFDIMRICGNRLLEKMFLSMMDEIQEARSRFPGGTKELRNEFLRHKEIYEAVASGDPRRARAAMKAHFRGTEAIQFSHMIK